MFRRLRAFRRWRLWRWGTCCRWRRRCRRARRAARVVVIPVNGVIDEGMAHMIERAVKEANDAHASAIVLDVNTPGGLVERRLRDSRRALRSEGARGGVRLASGPTRPARW